MTPLPFTLEKRKQHCTIRVLKASNCTEVELDTERVRVKQVTEVGADNHGWKFIDS